MNNFTNALTHLEKSLQKLNDKISNSEKSFHAFLQALQEQSLYLSSSYNEMDVQEARSVKLKISQIESQMQTEKTQQLFWKKSLSSPFFGSIDWKEEDEKLERLYIGISGIEGNKAGEVLVCDWRAPISSLFYDYANGLAEYKAPIGLISGTIEKKHQYKIQDGKFLFELEVDEKINDDILREALSENSNGQMKTIVSTIQKQQNKIIRNPEMRSMVIQGLAGSGKTSIALHRIAFLLYRQREKLTAENVLILSPSLVFSKFIGLVMPELGEENIENISFDSLAKENISRKILIENRQDMLDSVLESTNHERLKAINKKATFEFLETFEDDMKNLFANAFVPQDIILGESVVKKEKLLSLWQEKYANQTVSTKIKWLCEYVLDELEIASKKVERVYDRITKILFSFVKITNSVEVLKFLYEKQNLTLNFTNASKLQYEDIPYLLLINNHIFSIKIQSNKKLLIIDEMQDYSPAAFKLIKTLYSCPMIILGDIHQSVVHNYDEAFLTKLAKFADNAQLYNLTKCYRSTQEISNFAQSFINVKGENFERKGNPILYTKTDSFEKALSATLIAALSLSKTGTCAVILPTSEMEEQATQAFRNANIDTCQLIESGKSKIIISLQSECKGLEFDNVICLSKEPNTKELRKSLYISSSRALHNLIVITF